MPRGHSEYGSRALKAATKPRKTYGVKRVCSHEDCGTILSMYNPDDRCFAHRVRKVPVV